VNLSRQGGECHVCEVAGAGSASLVAAKVGMGWGKERVGKRYSRTEWLISEAELLIKALSKVSRDQIRNLT